MKKVLILIVIICLISCATIFVLFSNQNTNEKNNEKEEIKSTPEPTTEVENDIYRRREGETISAYTNRVFGYIPSQDVLLQYNDMEGYYKYYGKELPKYNSTDNTPQYPGFVSETNPMKDGENIAEYTHRVFGYWPSQQELYNVISLSKNISKEDEVDDSSEMSWQEIDKYFSELENDESTKNPKEKLTNINNKLSKFDLDFLKMENNEKNMIYSPLSIKYALLMLKEGSEGETKSQIEKVISNYTPNRYHTNKHTSLANAMFIKDTFANGIKESYKNTLKEVYDADLKYDDFSDVKNINSWIKEKTMGIIPKLYEAPDDWTFILINALAIDMRWNDVFFHPFTWYEAEHEDIFMYYPNQLSTKEFLNMDDKLVKGMDVEAYINNYDIVKDLGEDNIKQIVSEDYKKFVGVIPGESHGFGDFPLGDHEYDYRYTEQDAEDDLKDFLPGYIEGLKSNYNVSDSTTDFELYVDDDIKVFRKELTKYDNTTLEYIGIMPKKKDLKDFINASNSESINDLISKTKNIGYENFKDGVVTHIVGFIPRFNYEYDLTLKDDLIELGIKDVFEPSANLKGISEVDGIFITDAKHKAKIEFNEEGIKAAAVTAMDGGGGGAPYDYKFDVPIEEIDITFDRPYMYIIKDKDTEEVWFVGTVYTPETE